MIEALRAAIRDFRPRVSTSVPGAAIEVVVRWSGNRARPVVRNRGLVGVPIDEVVLFDGPHALPSTSAIAGESFQMLAQIAGTLGKPEDVGTYPDRTHYRIPEPGGLRTAYGFLAITPPATETVVVGFGSCHRFVGRIGFDARRLRISVDTEGLVLEPGREWTLEELMLPSGADSAEPMDALARSLRRHHRRRLPAVVPTGWCSWYHYGPAVTAADIAVNCDWAARNLPSLRYIQIDDGYQPHMGDWLEVGKAFGGDVRAVLDRIRTSGFEPAIWVAPFIADAGSRLFREHPEWFVRGADGKPMPSDRVGFGGWRMGPWYCLDGTHPGARRHLEDVFRTMRREWGCTYFKLDANYWGAIHGGFRHDAAATRVEAYRRGMEAVRRGAGNDAILLGCNHPLWPSIGTIDASRSSNDISRDWATFKGTARENLLRGWQNGKLWWNDPDCLLLTGDLPETAFTYHATALYATGGMVLSGDALPAISADRLRTLRALLPPTGVAARFADPSLTVGEIRLRGRTRYAVFNHGDAPEGRTVRVSGRKRLRDIWSGEDLGVHEGALRLPPLPPRSARLIEGRPA
ncbi:MAG: glycoside hydrolase family 36 protein [Armatimonadota bacterium]